MTKFCNFQQLLVIGEEKVLRIDGPHGPKVQKVQRVLRVLRVQRVQRGQRGQRVVVGACGASFDKTAVVG